MDEGLLDFLKTPVGQGLLATVAGGLAGARRGQPLNSLGRAGLSGLQGFANAQNQQISVENAARQQKLNDLQIGELQNKIGDQKLERETAAKFLTPGSPGIGLLDSSLPPQFQTGVQPKPAKPPSFDLQGFANARLAQNPQAGLALLASLQKEIPINKIDPKDFTPESLQAFAGSGGRNFGVLQPRTKLEVSDGFAFDPFDKSLAGRSLPNPNKPFSIDQTGAVKPNLPFQQFEIAKGRAGATNTSIKIDNKLGEGLAKEVGPILKDSALGALGAAKQIDAADQITRAVDSNKLFSGPGANVRLTLAQAASTLGIGGKDDAEKIANTRATLQGLANLTLQGRQQMRGQGAVTESESKLAERAVSGDISFTSAEIKQLADAARRAGGFTLAEHNRKLDAVKANPDLEGLVPFFSVGAPDQAPQQAPQFDFRSAAAEELRRRTGAK